MNIKKFRTLSKRPEIISLLQECGPLIEGIVWQPTAVERAIFTLYSMSVDQTNEMIILKATTPISLDVSLPAYVSIQHKGLIFKLSAKQYKFSREKLTCPFPTETRAHDLRANPRTSLSVKSDLSINLTYAGLLANGLTKFRVMDYSCCGIGLVAPEANKDFFSKGMCVSIKSIGDRIFNETVMAKVSYVAANPLKKSEIRVGLALKAPFTDDQLHNVFLSQAFSEERSE